jgi:Ca-activated chloride channel family protein
MFQFANPIYFLLILPLAAAAWRIYARHINSGIRFGPTARIPGNGRSWRTIASRILPAITLIGLMLLIIAMARPRTVLSKSHKTSDVIAIEMVVDISGSMEALDLSKETATGTKYKTRLDVVKEAFNTFIDKRQDDLVGLISFAGYVSTLAPMTPDHEAIKHVLKGVETPKAEFDANGNVINQDEMLTAIGDALATACARIENADPVSKIMVLLSDGESNTGMIQPPQAIEVAKKLGIKVYTIGIGSTGRAPFMATDSYGRKRISYAMVSLDENLLRSIADETGAIYYNIQDEKGLDKALAEINKLETTKIEQDIYTQYRELYKYFIFAGAILILLGLTLNMTASKRLL